MAYSETNNKDTVYSYEQGNKYLKKWRSFVNRFTDDAVDLGLPEEESIKKETSTTRSSSTNHYDEKELARLEEDFEIFGIPTERFFTNVRQITLIGEEEEDDEHNAVKEVPKNTYILAKILANKAECYYIISTDDDTTNPTATYVLANLTHRKLKYGTFLSGLDCVLNVDSIDRVSIIETLQVRDNTSIEEILDVEGVDALPIFCAN